MKALIVFVLFFSLRVEAQILVHPVIPIEAKQLWTLKQYDITEAVPSHYHQIRRQFLVATDGSLHVICDGKDRVLQMGDLMCIEPGTRHEIHTEGHSRFFVIDLPGFPFPEDVFENDLAIGSNSWVSTDMKVAPVLEERYFGPRLEKGSYALYNLVSSDETDGKYGIALLEILDSPKHFHYRKTEQFLVVQGTLHIEIDGEFSVLERGDSVAVYPEQIHKLRSANGTPVRVLCFSFPASIANDLVFVD